MTSGLRLQLDPLDAQARTKLNAMHDDMQSWRLVALECGYTSNGDKGLVYHVAKGKKRAPNSLLYALGLQIRGVTPRTIRHSERDNERITIRLYPSLVARITERAKATGVSRAKWLRALAEDAVGLVPRE